jgi:predicted GNAT family acetyltransferase
MQAIRNDFETSRFIAYVDGQVVGSLQYRIQDDQMWLLDVDVAPEHRDLGLSAGLVREALGEAGRRRLSILPLCHEARTQVLGHPVFLQLVPSEQRRRLGRFSPDARKRTRRGGAGSAQAGTDRLPAARRSVKGGEAA